MWQSLEVNGSQVDLLEPPGERPARTIVFLHDQDGRTLSDNTRATELLLQKRIACVCPRGGAAWWSDRVCHFFGELRSAEHWLLRDVFPVIDKRWNLRPKSVALAGIGMGGQGALRLSFKHPERFHVVAALDAALDHYELHGLGTPLDDMYSSREHCRQDSAILHIHPARQPSRIWFSCNPGSRWFRGNDRLHEKLTALGVAHSFHIGPGSFDELLDFVLDSLAQEIRSLA